MGDGKLKISWIKSKTDDKSFKMAKGLGFDVYELEELEKVDAKIAELVEKKYHTIVISSEIAAFSEDIAKKYQRSKDVNIFITPNKK